MSNTVLLTYLVQYAFEQMNILDLTSASNEAVGSPFVIRHALCASVCVHKFFFKWCIKYIISIGFVAVLNYCTVH